MMAHTIYPATRLSQRLGRFSLLSSSQGFRLRSQPEMSFWERQSPALNFQPSNGRSNGIQCYCTKVKNGEHIQSADITTTVELSKVKNVQVTDCDKESVVENDTALHVGEQIKTTHLSDSGTTSHNFGCINEDEPLDHRALIEIEIQLLRLNSGEVPDIITALQWEELLSKPSRGTRRKYLRYLFIKEIKKQKDKKKKELNRDLKAKELDDYDSKNRHISEDGHIQYGLWCNSIFLRIYSNSIKRFNEGRVISAMMHGQPLVIDLGFYEHMTSREQRETAKQLMDVHATNRTHPDPFYLNFCNADRSSFTMKHLERIIPTLYNPEFCLTVTPESYVDRFPKKKLIYLTPHCKEELTTFDHDAIYIIGGIVDLANSEPVTLAKAKREGILMQKLPLDRYLNWGDGGSKHLTLEQVLAIMLDMKHTDDWHYSLRHVPRRKLKKSKDSRYKERNYERSGDSGRFERGGHGHGSHGGREDMRGVGGSAGGGGRYDERRDIRERDDRRGVDRSGGRDDHSGGPPPPASRFIGRVRYGVGGISNKEEWRTGNMNEGKGSYGNSSSMMESGVNTSGPSGRGGGSQGAWRPSNTMGGNDSSTKPKDVSGEECYFWRTTGCRFGDRCKYKHIPSHKGILKP